MGRKALIIQPDKTRSSIRNPMSRLSTPTLPTTMLLVGPTTPSSPRAMILHLHDTHHIPNTDACAHLMPVLPLHHLSVVDPRRHYFCLDLETAPLQEI